jgi:predicted transcriptional regulator
MLNVPYTILLKGVTKAYRGRYLIIAHMLNTINDTGIEDATKTLIMYKAFLSYAQLSEYLSFLVEKGLLLNSFINLTRGKVIKRELGLSLLNRSITIVTTLYLNT